MKIGISSAVLYPMQSEKAIKKLVSLGFDTFEFFYNCDEEISKDFINEIGNISKKCNFASVHPYTAFAEAILFFSGYQRRTEEAIEKYRNSFRMAKKLGARFFTLHGDRALNGIDDKTCSLSDNDISVLSCLARAAREEGIWLALENVSWCKSANINYLKNVYESVPDIFFTLDLKQARRAGIPYESYISAMGDRLCNIHVSDYNEESNCILPGEGLFDFNLFCNQIKEINYAGDVLIEVYSKSIKDDKQLMNSKFFLESVFSQIKSNITIM